MITFDSNRLSLESGYTILDIGCGSGRHMAAIYDKKNVPLTVIGADLGFEDLIFANKRMKIHAQFARHRSVEWDLSVADITCLPFVDGCFDLIICSEVLEHVIDDKRAVNELVRVLKNKKTLVVSVPRYLPEKLCWILSEEYTRNSQKHVRIYRKHKLIRLLESSGLSCYDSHYSHSLHTPFWWLKCIVGPAVTNSILVNLYHKILVWDMMKRPYITRFLDKLLNPILGKSVVLYTIKDS